MKNKAKEPTAPLISNVFAQVSYDTYLKLITLAATLGIGRLELYKQAITWAINQEQFVVDMAKGYKGNEVLGAE